jgi:hypothetical protein
LAKEIKVVAEKDGKTEVGIDEAGFISLNSSSSRRKKERCTVTISCRLNGRCNSTVTRKKNLQYESNVWNQLENIFFFSVIWH